MTKQQKEKLMVAKKGATTNLPKELKSVMVDMRRSKDKRSSNQILMEMRYGCRSLK